MRLRIMLLVTLVVVPMGLIAAWSVSKYLEELLDPCIHWSMGSSGSFTLPAQTKPGDPCGGGFKATSRTKGQAAVMGLMVPGCILMAVILALIGAALSRPGIIVVVACIMFLEAIPLVWSFAPVAALTGAALMFISNWMRSHGSPGVQRNNDSPMGLKARLRRLFCKQHFFFSE